MFSVDENGQLTNRGIDKAEMFGFFGSVFNTSDGLWDPRCPELEGSDCGKLPASSNLCGICCSTWAYISPWSLMGFVLGYSDLADVVVRPLSILIIERSSTERVVDLGMEWSPRGVVALCLLELKKYLDNNLSHMI